MSEEEVQQKSELEEHLEAEEAQSREEVGDDTAHDLAEESMPQIDKPEGSPGLVSVAMLTKLYDTRADFYERAAGVDIGLLSKVASGELDPEDPSLAFPVMAAYTRSISSMLEALRCVARDKKGFDGWSKAAGDEDRMMLFFWYLSEMQPGEAQPSPTS